MSEWSNSIAQVGHDGRQLRLRILAPQLPPRTRPGRQGRLEVIDRLSPQNQVLQELARTNLSVSRAERKHATGAEQNCTTWVVPDGPGLAGGVGPLALTVGPAWASARC